MVGALIFALLVVATVAIGCAVVGPAALDPALVPWTPFTDGHRIALGFGDGTLGARTLPLAGGADFRPLLWPVELLSQVVGPDRALVAAFVLTPVFNGVAGWILGAALRLPRWGRFVLGAALAWNPWVHTTLANGQLEQAVIGGAALMWAASAWGFARLDEGSGAAASEQALASSGAAKAGFAKGVGSFARPVGAALLTAGVTFLVAAAAPHVALAGCAGLAALAVAEVASAAGGRTWLATRLGRREGGHAEQAKADVKTFETAENPGARRPNRTAPLVVMRWVFVLSLTAIAALSAARYHAASFDAVVRLFAPFGSTAGEEAPAVAQLAPTGVSVKREIRLRDLVVPPEPPPRMARGVVHSGHVGIVLLVVAGFGLRRRWAPALYALTCLGLAFGGAGPYALLAAVSSTVAESNTPYRFVLGAVVGLAASAALFPWRGWSALLVVGALWAAGWWGDPRALPLTAERVEHDPSSLLLRDGTGPVLDLPISGPNCREGATHFLLEGTVHRRPLPLVLRPGYDAYATAAGKAEARVIDEGLASCSEAAVAAIRGYATVVAHGHRACNLGPAETACLRRHFGAGTAKGKVVWWETAR
jgi:hypothetical protein